MSYRGTSGDLEIYKGGSLDEVETVIGGLPVDPATMRVEYTLADFNAGSVVSYEVFFDAETTAFTSGTFSWSGTNENYLSLSSNLNEDSRFDNLEVRGGLAAEDYSSWSAGFPGADLSDLAGDFDGDGVVNNDERIFGLDPTDSSSITPFVSILNTEGAFSYTRRDPTLTGYTYRIFTSTDLEVWNEDLGAISEPSAPNASSVETVAVTLSAEPAEGRLFVRVGANPPAGQ